MPKAISRLAAHTDVFVLFCKPSLTPQRGSNLDCHSDIHCPNYAVSVYRCSRTICLFVC